MQGKTSGEIFRILQDSGLETRWHGQADERSDPKPLQYYEVKDCSAPCLKKKVDPPFKIDVVERPPPPWRINFRFGWSPGVYDERYKFVEPIPALYFTDAWAETLLGKEKKADGKARLAANDPPATSNQPATNAQPNKVAPANDPPASRSIVLIAVTTAVLGDWDYTPIGQLPGGMIHANAIYAFTDGGFLRAPSGGDLGNDLLHLVGLLAATCAATVLLAFVYAVI